MSDNIKEIHDKSMKIARRQLNFIRKYLDYRKLEIKNPDSWIEKELAGMIYYELLERSDLKTLGEKDMEYNEEIDPVLNWLENEKNKEILVYYLSQHLKPEINPEAWIDWALDKDIFRIYGDDINFEIPSSDSISRNPNNVTL